MNIEPEHMFPIIITLIETIVYHLYFVCFYDSNKPILCCDKYTFVYRSELIYSQ